MREDTVKNIQMPQTGRSSNNTDMRILVRKFQQKEKKKLSLWFQRGWQASYFFPSYSFTELFQDNVIKQTRKKKGRPWSFPLSDPKLSCQMLWTCFKWSERTGRATHNFTETQGKAFDKSFDKFDLANKEAQKLKNHWVLTCYNTICLKVHSIKLKCTDPLSDTSCFAFLFITCNFILNLIL